MKMRDIYEVKQREWEAFRAAERQRRIDKAKQTEFDRLAGIIAQSRARKEYTLSKFKQSLSVRSHHHAAVVIQRAFRAMKCKRSWQERVRVRQEKEQREKENKAAVRIQHVWKRYQRYKKYRAAYFKSIYTSPVVALPDTAPYWGGQEPSYKRSISITGKMVKTILCTLHLLFLCRKPQAKIASDQTWRFSCAEDRHA